MKKVELSKQKKKLTNATKKDYVLNLRTGLIYRGSEIKPHVHKDKVYLIPKKSTPIYEEKYLLSNFMVVEDTDGIDVLGKKEEKINTRKVFIIPSDLEVTSDTHPFNKWVILFLTNTYDTSIVVKDSKTTNTLVRGLKGFFASKPISHKKLEMLLDQIGSTYEIFMDFINKYRGV